MCIIGNEEEEEEEEEEENTTAAYIWTWSYDRNGETTPTHTTRPQAWWAAPTKQFPRESARPSVNPNKA